jgi:serine/threonine protein kinase
MLLFTIFDPSVTRSDHHVSQVYEADTFTRFQGHPNIVSLYSYWSEKPNNPYTYKTLVLLFEEGILGDMSSTVVRNPKRPNNRLALRYLTDIAKGLIAIHNCNIIHARIKPSSLYLDSNNTALIGEFGKVELDSARQTHQVRIISDQNFIPVCV